MADSSHLTDDGTNTQTARSVLLKRNPHLRGNDTSSPAGFGGLGTRQFLQKQLMTPGSATSASSFEEGASYDGFSDAGTPASEESSQHRNLYVKTESGETHYATRTGSKQPTKRLSSPSRESLARRLVDEASDDLPPSELITNVVVKTVPTITVDGEASAKTTMVPLSPRSTKITRRIVASPRKTMRRVVLRKTGEGGKVHEQVQYVDADGQVVQQSGNFFNETTNSGRTTVSQRERTDKSTKKYSTSTPMETSYERKLEMLLLALLVHEEAQYLDADGNVVQNDGSNAPGSSSSAQESPPSSDTSSRTTVTRRVVRRMVVHGNVIEEGALVSAGSFTGSVSSVTSESTGSRRVVTRRVVASPVRRTVAKAGSSSSGAESEDDVQYVESEAGDRVVRRMVVRKGAVDSGAEADEDELDIDEFVQSEGSSDESVGGSSRPGSSRDGYTVSDRIVIPGSGKRRVVSRTVTSSNQNVATESNASSSKRDDGVADKAPVPTTTTDATATPETVAAVSTSHTEPNVEATSTTDKNPKSPRHTRRGSGGFWGFFGKSEEEPTTVAAPVEVSEDAFPSWKYRYRRMKLPEPPRHQRRDQEPQESRESDVEKPITATSYEVGASDDSNEEKAPFLLRSRKLMSSITVAAGVATVASIHALDKKPDVDTSKHHGVIAPAGEASSRKAGRSIWKFWGADKPTSLSDEEDKTVAASVPSADEAGQHWQLQDEQNPTQISYAAATYSPEAKVESMPAVDKIASPVARGQNTQPSTDPRVEITQTTVQVEEEFESGRVYHDAVAAPIVDADTVDITVETEAQEAKPRVGFWGFLGKKDKSAATINAGSVSDSKSVSWAVEDDEKPATVVQVEAVRRSLPSDDTPNVSETVESSGKLVRESERRPTELIEPDVELEEHYVEVMSPRSGGRTLDDEGLWAVEPCSLAWSNLRLNRKNWKSVPTGMDGYNEDLLDDVSGSVKAGEFLVITGPSKDESLALLSCLAGFEDAMDGNVTVNGREWNDKMSRYIAYVMREDLFYETFTNTSSFKLNFACVVPTQTRFIEDLGLSGCRDKLIGGGISLSGITRGERKLLAIATALLTNPSILLVEEPTHGLDTFNAEKIVAKLRWLAFEKGLTVAVTLHHSSSHFYGLFDVLYLVADASCVYDGKASDAVAYFSTIGYQCPEYTSPMDYFMLQMVVGDRESDDVGVARVETLKREWSDRNASVYAENTANAAAAKEQGVVEDYDQKNRYYHLGCCGQLWLLWARHIRRLSRYNFIFWWHLLAALLIGVVFGLVYLQLDLDDQKGIQNFSGSFFYVVVVQMLFVAYRTFIFVPRETAIALRERQEYRGGWYHLLCWYWTKIVAELPVLVILSMALFVPVFLLVGIGHGFKVYVYMQIVLVLAGWAAIGLAFLTLGVLRHVTLALIVYTMLLTLFVAFGGLLINVSEIPDWLVWLHYISPVKYAYEAMMKIFWKRVDSIDCDWTLEGCVALTGEGVLKFYSMEKRSALGDTLILFAVCFALFFVAFWFLLMLANKRISGLQWRYDWEFKGLLGRKQQRVGNTTVSEKHAATRSRTQRVIERKSHHSSSAAGDNCYIQVETPRVGDLDLSLKAQTDSETQYLLSDASGSAKSGELLLITGPSDKSNVALLESLGGLQKRLKAYVAREDLFYETLTVEEHLRFQAQLVVGTSADLEIERVEMVLDELELAAKRAQPTCGMDFYSSQRVVLKLRQLARGGRTVVVTMTHPSSHLYALFDSLYVLADGAAVYNGKVIKAVPYFASLGYQCPQYMSPVDYFIRQVSVNNETADGQSTLFKEAWAIRYSEFSLADTEDQELQDGATTRRRVGICGQLSLLFRRHILRLARYRVVLGWHAFWMIVLGVIFGLIYLQLDLGDQQDIQNWAGAFFFIVVLQMLVIAYRTFVFLPREMAIAEREHRFGELPAMLVLSILLFVPAYLLIGIGHGFKLYFYMQIVMWLAGWSAAGMASLLLGILRRVRLLINVDDIPDYLIWLHYISPVKYGYETMMKLFWGRIGFLACGGSDGSGSGSSTFATVGDDYSFSMSGSGSYENDEAALPTRDEVLSHYSMDSSRDARSEALFCWS
ncbi:P-loop containing nucleoside triphosphate hydrolase [Phytophthora cactorum]|nr:P-loop containing nucleoside triphosphate hydrolase [Phytophthora cactorum]